MASPGKGHWGTCPLEFANASDVNKDWTHNDKDKDQTRKESKDKDLTYNDLQGLTRTYR